MIDIQDLMSNYYNPSIEELDSDYYILTFIEKLETHETYTNVTEKQLKQLKENVNRIYNILQKNNF